MAKKQEVRVLTPIDARPGKQLAYEGVAIEIVEVNEVKAPYGSSIWAVAYRIHDQRQAPPFISQVAHLWANMNTNLIAEFQKVRDHYEEIKSTLRG